MVRAHAFERPASCAEEKRPPELEVTEYVENDRVRIVADTHGSVWDSVFTVSPVEGGTRLDLVMEATARDIKAKMANTLMKGMLQKALEQDLDAVKAYCEAP